jgi:hypothetical protein cdifQCD_20406|nr:MAG TPA: protein of unknown function (DUF4428) [Caudoviricetes sp.]
MATSRKRCTACGEDKRPAIDFYLSRSKLYKFNDGRMPVCKECLSKLFKELNAKYSDEVKALYHLCMLFDIYFDRDLVEKSSANNNFSEEDNLLKSYMKNVNSLNQYKFKDSMSSDCVVLDDNLLENKKEEVEINNKTLFEVTDKMEVRWGASLPIEDYMFLESKYKEFTDVYECRTPAQRLIFEQIAKCLLRGEKALKKDNDVAFEKMNNMVSKLMTDGNIKPIQEASVAEDDTATWGKWINLIEQERPIGEPCEQFKDVDKISTYITKWFTRQMQRVFDLSTGEEDDN